MTCEVHLKGWKPTLNSKDHWGKGGHRLVNMGMCVAILPSQTNSTAPDKLHRWEKWPSLTAKGEPASNEWRAACFLVRRVWITASTWAMSGSCWTRRRAERSSPRRASSCCPWCWASSWPSASSTTLSCCCCSANSRNCARRWTCCCWTSASATCWCVCSEPLWASRPAFGGGGCWGAAAAAGTASSTHASVSYVIFHYSEVPEGAGLLGKVAVKQCFVGFAKSHRVNVHTRISMGL